jgi:hypothetical protein
MAKLIPSGVVNLPNFAELQYNLNERERQKQLQFDEWSSQFDKKAGTYLDGDKEAVQTAYSGVEAALKELARDPDNVDLRRKVREANASYNEVAGTAQFLADNYRQQWSAYNTEPDKFGVSGQEAIDLFNRERSTKRDANQIMSLASNPFTLNPKYKYDMQSPTQIADEAAANFRKNINDYIRPDGTIDQEKAREYMVNFMDARYIDPNQVKNAVVYEGVREGVIGRNGEVTSRADLDVVDTEQFAPQRDRLANKFSTDAVDAFMAIIPRMGVNPVDLNLQKQKINLELKKLQQESKTKIPKEYLDLKPIGVGGQAGGVMYRIDNKPVKTSNDREIVGFGKLGGQDVVIVQEKITPEPTPSNPMPKTQTVELTVRAGDVDISNLRQQMFGAYDAYIGGSVQQNAVPSQQGFSLEEYIKEKEKYLQ